MIQLANDPSANRTAWRPAAAAKASEGDSGRARARAHAWPFLSKSPQHRPAMPDTTKPRNDSGS